MAHGPVHAFHIGSVGLRASFRSALFSVCSVASCAVSWSLCPRTTTSWPLRARTRSASREVSRWARVSSRAVRASRPQRSAIARPAAVAARRRCVMVPPIVRFTRAGTAPLPVESLALLPILVDGLLDGGGGGVEPAGHTGRGRGGLADPVVRLLERGQLALKVRHHLFSEQLVGLQRRLAVGQLAAHQQVAAKPPA